MHPETKHPEEIPAVIFGLRELNLVRLKAKELIRRLESDNLVSMKQYIELLEKEKEDAISQKKQG